MIRSLSLRVYLALGHAVYLLLQVVACLATQI